MNNLLTQSHQYYRTFNIHIFKLYMYAQKNASFKRAVHLRKLQIRDNHSCSKIRFFIFMLSQAQFA
jgi:hypothetical protein